MGWRDYAKAALLFNVVCVIWVFFRAGSFEGAIRYLELLATSGNTIGWPVLQTTIVAVCVALHVAERAFRLRAPALRARMGEGGFAAVAEGIVFGLVLALTIMVSGAGGEFIYFQF